MEQRSERTGRFGSERDVRKGSYLQNFTSGKRISQSDISSREKGLWQQGSNQSKKPQQIRALPAFHNERFALPKIFITEWRLRLQIDLKDAYFSVPLRVPEISKISMGRKLVRVPIPLFWTRPSTKSFYHFTKGSNFSAKVFDD